MALVVLNFKAYKEAAGENSVKMAQIAKEVAESSEIRIIVCPQTADLYRTSPIIETMAQHIDPIEPGAGTGSLLAEVAKEAGAIGSLLNHSEHKLEDSLIEQGINKLRNLGMLSIVCSSDEEKSKKLAAFNPDYIAVEPPELIGSGISVSTAKPEVVSGAVKNVKDENPEVKVLCGAGISNGNDVSKALELGVEGVLLASAFIKAQDPKAILEDIVGGLK